MKRLSLAKFRRIGNDVFFGQNLIHRDAGEVAVGADVTILARRAPLVPAG